MKMLVSIRYRQASGKSTNDSYCLLESPSVELPPLYPHHLESKGLRYSRLAKQVCLTFNDGIDFVINAVQFVLNALHLVVDTLYVSINGFYPLTDTL